MWGEATREGPRGGLGHAALERSYPPPALLSPSGKPGRGLRRVTAANWLPSLGEREEGSGQAVRLQLSALSSGRPQLALR